MLGDDAVPWAGVCAGDEKLFAAAVFIGAGNEEGWEDLGINRDMADFADEGPGVALAGRDDGWGVALRDVALDVVVDGDAHAWEAVCRWDGQNRCEQDYIISVVSFSSRTTPTSHLIGTTKTFEHPFL
jgi:hypothetical protein